MGPQGGPPHGDPSTPATTPVAPVAPWVGELPWLVAGITLRRPLEQRPNFGLFTDLPAREAMESWEGLLQGLGAGAAVHSRQVHGPRVSHHLRGVDPVDGLRVVDPGDGHVTREVALLLTVTVADCVPVYVVDPARKAIGLFHAGWRGAAAGVLEEGLDAMAGRFGSRPSDCLIHLGVSICGDCYEVGPEVFAALGEEVGSTLDLRAVLRGRALSRGVPSDGITTDHQCTLCDQDRFFSHRGGDPGRQVAFMMVNDV